MSWSLIHSPRSKRYQKAVDSGMGVIVGYARWVLPPILCEDGERIEKGNGRGVWEEGMLQLGELSEEEKKGMEKRFHAVSENGQLKGFDHKQAAFRNAPLEEADARVTKDCPFICNPPSPHILSLLHASELI
jgi:hypothetical protein